MTNNQLNLIRCIAENRFQDARVAALACCAEDKTKKNEVAIQKYTKIIKTGSDYLNIEIPYNIKGFVTVEDMSNFNVDRYYLEEGAERLSERIQRVYNAALKLMELNIPYTNATLLTGESGTGKTTFAKYMAYKLGLPYVYVNFANISDSLMGKTAQNICRVFEFLRNNKCLLMLDEIDAIGTQRVSGTSGADKERSNITVTLLQELDKLRNDSIVMAATNIPDEIDKAIIRRFPIRYKFSKLTPEENKLLIKKFVLSIDMNFELSDDDVQNYVYIDGRGKNKVQAEIISDVTEAIVDALAQNTRVIEL